LVLLIEHNMNKNIFFQDIQKSLFNGRLNNSQKRGIDNKLTAFDIYDIVDVRWQAYMLATCYHETARAMQPIEEIGKGAGRPYGKKIKHNRTVYYHPDKLYFGRGDVQLTWYENYELMGKLLKYPLLKYPELALEPDISARIMIEGMTKGVSNRGDFTGVSLEDYFNYHKEDPINARRIINGLDQAKLISGYYYRFLYAIIISKE
jgi:putative chitinase